MTKVLFLRFKLAIVLSVSIGFTYSSIAQELPTHGSINTSIGTLTLKNGYPTEATSRKINDDIDSQRAAQVYLWALPLMGMVQWQSEQRNKFDAGNLDYVDY